LASVQKSRINKEEKLKGMFLKAMSGDELSYAQFLSETSDLLKMFLSKMLSRSQSGIDVQDVVQEVLISIHNKRDLYDQEKDILPWLYAIARYRMIDFMRSLKRQPNFSLIDEILEDPFNLEEELSLLLGESSGEDLLKSLSPHQKKLVWLAKVDEKPLQEIADENDLSLSSVKVTIHRSLKALRKKIEK
jgi:RNA polymerase sigma-70 factor (ECF subfamily)